MMHFENDDDDISALFAPVAGNLPSPGLAPSYAASPSPTRSLFNHGGLTCNPVTEMGTAENAAAAALTGSEMSEKAETTTNVVHHLHRDSYNTECDSLFDMTGGMVSSPQFAGFSGDKPLFVTPDMGMSTSPTRMNYFPPPSGDSIGNSDPFRLRNFADDSEVQELENKEGMTMRPTWKQQQPCIEEVDTVLGQKRLMNYSLPSDDSHFLGGSIDLYRLRDAGEYSQIHELRDVKRVVQVTVSWNDYEFSFHKESWLNIAVHEMEKGLPVAHTDYNLFWKCKYAAFNLLEFEIGTRKAWIEHKSVTRPPRRDLLTMFSGDAVFEFLGKDFVQPILEPVLLTIIRYLNSAIAGLEFRGDIDWVGVDLINGLCLALLIKQLVNIRIPKSSATNEERNDVVELNNSIDDAKGGSSSSDKTDTISRWEKDHGITRQVLQQLFGKSRDAAAETLKVSTSTFKRACRDFGINRWPNHKGKMPNCSLNQKKDVQAVKKHIGIQPCPALPPLEGTNTSQCNSTIMSVKVTYKNDTIRFPLSSSSTIKYLEEQLETKLKISVQNFSIKYQDEEDEWITLTCDSELLHGMEVLRSCGKTVIRMMVTPKFN